MLIKDALRIRRGDVVTLVGGGGKTTLMFRLAEELTAAGMTVVTTMTTKIFVGQMERAPAHLLLEDERSLFAALPEAIGRHRPRAGRRADRGGPREVGGCAAGNRGSDRGR